MLSGDSSLSTNNNHRNLIIYCVIMFLCVFFRDVFGIPINKYVLLIIVIFGYNYLNQGCMVAFIAFLIPFLPGLPANYIIGVAIFFFLFKERRLRISFFAGAVYVFLILQLIHLFAPESSLGNFMKFSVYIILLTLILIRKESNYNNAIILFSYGIGVIAAFTSIFVNTLKHTSVDEIFEKGIRIGNIASVNQEFDSSIITLTIDQNTLGYFCAIAICAFLILLFAKKIHPISAIFFISITFVYGSLTLSRTFILITFISFIYYFILNLRLNRGSIKSNMFLLTTIILILINIQLFFPSTLETLINRFQERDLSNGRIDIFLEYNQFMFSDVKNFLFGIGLQNMHSKAGLYHVPHNGFQQVFVSGGIIGLLLFLIWIIGMYFNNKPSNARNVSIYTLPFFTLLIYIQGLQFLSPYIIMLPLIVSMCSLRLSNSPN